ncbi:hypothetical protein CHL76_06845 [Marinococcus halophilus]|uniref:YwdI family protein n=1 Tax=Marinococcus halophilus TaxID=1371 RepID=A0A510Y6L1_MARHA|nr:DUF5327 family protein [Marinococcus halophilus]OZT80640.1 hypothetical protein CHL76_06845 [Marinococcus halophilus]GEK59000.1 hypothetical protein MHA01_19050 [Marinococcus halophilus]
MQISVQTVIEKMEEELLQLAEQGEKGDERALQEHARTLRNYCDILLSSREAEVKQPVASPPRSGAPASASGVTAARNPRREPSGEEEEIPSTEGNLLDF